VTTVTHPQNGTVPKTKKQISPRQILADATEAGLETKTPKTRAYPDMYILTSNASNVNTDVDRLTASGSGSSPSIQDLVAVDFETYYDADYSVKNMGVHAYVQDPRFDCYLLSITLTDGWVYSGPPQGAPWNLLHRKIVVAHNATAFDRVVFEKLQADGVIPAWVKPAGWLDTAALSAYVGAPRDLKGAALQLLDEDLDKEYRSTVKGKHRDDLNQDEQAEVKAACVADAKACLEIACRYLDQWPDLERELARLHMIHIDRGIRVNRAKLRQGLAHLDRLKTSRESDIPWVSDGKAPSSPTELKKYAAENGLPVPASFSKKNSAYLQWEQEYGEAHPVIRAVRDWREVNGLLTRLGSIKRRIRKDGRIAADLLYFGAGTTGRASGGNLNLQALPNGKRFGVGIRSMLIPDEGHVFLQVDLAQIEPRVVATLMQDESILQQVRQGVSLYEAYARSYLGWAGGKLKQEDPRLYALAKICMLSLSYGTSHVRYREACLEAGIELTESEARRAVEEYRRNQKKITAQWRSLEARFKSHAGRAEPFVVDLPSGRKLRYHNCAYRPSDYSWVAQPVQGKAHRKFWGSKLFENAIQATARDVFMQQMLELERQGLRTLFHVHDEVILEVPLTEVAAATEIVQRVMTTPPDWLPDLPLECEIKITTCFE